MHQTSVICTRMTSLYGFQPFLWFFSCKTATLRPDLQVRMGSKRIKRLYGFQPSRVVLCTESATLAHEFLVSIGPSPHLWLLHGKQRLLDQHTSLYGYQTSPVVLRIQNGAISTRKTSFYGFQPSSVVLCIENSDLRTE